MSTPPVLHAERTGRVGGRRLVLVHGFTQTARCWEPVLPALAAEHEVLAVDVPGHGGSAAVDADAGMAAAAIGAVGGRATYVGYSMGGRLCLRLAVDRPDLVERLVLIGATGGLEDAVEAAARRGADEALAERIEAIGVAAFLEEWLALPLFAGLSRDAAAVPERLRNTAAGLASSLRHCGTGAQEPVWDRLSALTAVGVPTLVVVGADDEKFVALGARLAAGIGPSATFATVGGAGHTAHLEQPGRFLALLLPWLATH